MTIIESIKSTWPGAPTCERCHKRPATFRVIFCAGDGTRLGCREMCESCAAPHSGLFSELRALLPGDGDR